MNIDQTTYLHGVGRIEIETVKKDEYSFIRIRIKGGSDDRDELSLTMWGVWNMDDLCHRTPEIVMLEKDETIAEPQEQEKPVDHASDRQPAAE